MQQALLLRQIGDPSYKYPSFNELTNLLKSGWKVIHTCSYQQSVSTSVSSTRSPEFAGTRFGNYGILVILEK